MENEKIKFLNIDTLEDSKYTEFGRRKIHYKNGKLMYMGIQAIKEYLGLESKIDKNFEKELRIEFNEFEKEFGNKNIDFCLNSDLVENLINYNVIKKGKLLSAFTL